MRKLLQGILIVILSQNTFGQHETDKSHERFIKYLEMEKVDSIYNSSLKKDDHNEKALLYRNQFGWALNKVEQLKKDIPSILELPLYSGEMAYESVFSPQKFPPTEWNRFYEICIELEKHFESNAIIYREILGIKTKLQWLTRNDKGLSIDLPKLLEKLNTNSDAYPMMLFHYGNLLIRNGENLEAQKVFEKGLKLNLEGDFLNSLIQIHANDKDFEKVISYEEQILGDPSGVLLYNLAEAQLKKNNRKKADKYFSAFISNFEYINYYPYVKIEFDNTVHHVEPVELELLGDFYVTSNEELACKLYDNANKILSDSNEERFYKQQMMTIQDETVKKKMIEEFEKHKIEQQELQGRIINKLKNCR